MTELTELLSLTFAGNTVARWLEAAATTVALVLVALLVRRVVRRRLRRLSERTDTSVDDSLIAAVGATNRVLLTVMAAFVGSSWLVLTDTARDGLGVALRVAVVLQVGLWVQRGVSHAVDRWGERHHDDTSRSTTGKAVGFAIKLGLWAFVVLFVLSNFGIQIDALIAGLGIGGIAAALAVQNILGDLLASLSIYVDRPFDVGDFIIVDDYLGVVKEVRWRSTRITSLGGEQIVFSNADLAKSRVRNYRRMEERRVAFEIGIEYNLPVELVRQAADLIREAIEAVDGVRFDRAHFKSYGDFALVYEAVYYVPTNDYTVYMDKQQQINLGIYERFQAAGIPFAFPARTIYLRQEHPLAIESTSLGSAEGGRD